VPVPVSPPLPTLLSLAALLPLGGCAPQKREPVDPNNILAVIDRNWEDAPRTSKRNLPPGTAEAFRLEQKADTFVEMTSDGRFNIEVTDAKGRLLDFHPDQLIRYFDHQRRKDLVVVCFHKQVWPQQVLQERIESTNRYFFDRGYRRVVIQQYMSFGRPTHSDRKRP